MAKYQYIQKEYTRVQLEKDTEKVKVVEGEIVESDLDPKYFLRNGFIEVSISAKKSNNKNKNEIIIETETETEKTI